MHTKYSSNYNSTNMNKMISNFSNTNLFNKLKNFRNISNNKNNHTLDKLPKDSSLLKNPLRNQRIFLLTLISDR